LRAGDTIAVGLYGVGEMGAAIARLLSAKPAARIVAAADVDPAKVGRELCSVAGVDAPGVRVVEPGPDAFVAADAVMHATTAYAAEAAVQLGPVLQAGKDVVSIAQELVFPLAQAQPAADRLHVDAMAGGATFLAAGVNPGFVMDLVPTVCALACGRIEHVEVRRTVDFSPYGPDEMLHIGAGLSEVEFARRAARDEVGHIGLMESAACLDESLALGADELRQSKHPIIATRACRTAHATIEPDHVRGFRQEVIGRRAGNEVLRLEMHALLDPDAEERATLGDVTVLRGEPSVEVHLERDVAQRGNLATAAVAVNLIPAVRAATPGFKRVVDLLPPLRWDGR
jgi:2,4-diaminopentanoate dehydrogenase